MVNNGTLVTGLDPLSLPGYNTYGTISVLNNSTLFFAVQNGTQSNSWTDTGAYITAANNILWGPNSSMGFDTSWTADNTGGTLTTFTLNAYLDYLAGGTGGGSNPNIGLAKRGNGTMIFSSRFQDQIYTGPTSIMGGTLQFSAMDNLGLGTSLVFNGGSLQYNGNTDDITANRNVNLLGNGIIDTNNVPSVTFSSSMGPIYGGGGLTKWGSGNLILSGSNNYTGVTNIGHSVRAPAPWLSAPPAAARSAAAPPARPRCQHLAALRHAYRSQPERPGLQHGKLPQRRGQHDHRSLLYEPVRRRHHHRQRLLGIGCRRGHELHLWRYHGHQ